MHEQVKKNIKRRFLTGENIGILIGALLAIALAMATDRKGMPQKWHAAIVGTVVPFFVVIMGLRSRWRRWSFWVALCICLAFHTLAICIIFQYVLWNVRSLGTLIWSPIAFVEIIVLLVAVKRVEQKLTGKRETFKLS